MTEDEARAWLECELNVSRETITKLERLACLLKAESERQNLIARSTLDHVWSRHILDSAQLLHHIPGDIASGQWLDLGSGAGFPGLVAAILRPMFHVKLVESRGLRITYLEDTIAALKLENASVAGMRLERLETREAAVISARAFAPLPQLLTLASRFSTENTIWLLPKGRNAAKELEEVNRQREWRGRLDFQILPSVTDAEAGILAGRLKPKGAGKR